MKCKVLQFVTVKCDYDDFITRCFFSPHVCEWVGERRPQCSSCETYHHEGPILSFITGISRHIRTGNENVVWKFTLNFGHSIYVHALKHVYTARARVRIRIHKCNRFKAYFFTIHEKSTNHRWQGLKCSKIVLRQSNGWYCGGSRSGSANDSFSHRKISTSSRTHTRKHYICFCESTWAY